MNGYGIPYWAIVLIGTIAMFTIVVTATEGAKFLIITAFYALGIK